MPKVERDRPWEKAFSMASPYIHQAVDTGMSCASFWRVVRDTGIAYAREKMREDWRAVKDIYKWETSIARLRPETPIPTRWVDVGRPKQKQNYLVCVEYTYTDKLTGEEETGRRFISSSKLYSKSRYEHTAQQAFAPGRKYVDPTATDFHVRFVLAKPGL